MKHKIIPILTFIMGAIIFGSIGIYAASEVLASQIRYKDTTVDAALNDLYDLSIDIENPDQVLNNAASITIDADYRYCILFVGRSNTNGNTLKLNGTTITPKFSWINTSGNTSIMGHVFKNLKENDEISFSNSGVVFCYY